MEPILVLSSGSFCAKVWAKSEAGGVTLTTIEATYPRTIHSELKTHRALSTNSASSRAIPIEKLIAAVDSNPFVPIHWGKNQKGMQAFEELSLADQQQARAWWLKTKHEAVIRAKEGAALGLHKQVVNRILEPWMWMTTIISATNLNNFDALRCHEAAEPHFQKISELMREARHSVDAKRLEVGEWHLPLYDKRTNDGGDDAPWVSAGRCARVSYLTHAGVRDVEADIVLAKSLATHKPAHASPLEHPACVVPLNFSKSSQDYGNFRPPFLQLRKTIPNECVEG